MVDKKVSRDVYFSVDVETDGPVPGLYSMLSFSLVYAGEFDGETFRCPINHEFVFYREMKPVTELYEEEALRVNQLDRNYLAQKGAPPERAMQDAVEWINTLTGDGQPVMVGYPVVFDWMWLCYYFTRYADCQPFGYSRGFDTKTAFSAKRRVPICMSGRSKLPPELRSKTVQDHHAVNDAIAQAEIFAKVFKDNSRKD